MYEAHFGLNRRPFIESVDPAGHVAGLPTREAVVRRLRYALEHVRGPALLFGPPGSGKTLIARVLAATVDGPSVHLTFPALPPAELFGELAEALGAEAPAGPDAGASGPLRRLRRRLAAIVGDGRRPLLVVDEAHLIDDPSTFEALRALLNVATFGPPDVMLLLVGAPEVVLALPEGMADRLAARCLLGPLTEPEADAYLNGRLAAAGATGRLFGPEAVRALHRAADGLPRRLNRLADLALLIAYAEGLPAPDARTVAAAVRDAAPDDLAA